MRRRFGAAPFARGLWLLSAGAVLVGTVLLSRQFGEVDRVADEEPQLVMPVDTVAPSLPPPSSPRPRTSARQQETPPTVSEPTVDRKAHDDQADEDSPVVDGETVRRAVEEFTETFSVMMPRVSTALSRRPGMGVRISSAAGSATLDYQGFTVTDLALRQRFGLQVGDTIVSLNGFPINSLDSAMGIFHYLFVRNRDLTELRVKIYRRGTVLYKTYRIAWR